MIKFKIEEVVTGPGCSPRYHVLKKEKIKWWWSEKWVHIGPPYLSLPEAQTAIEKMAEYPQVTKTWYFDRDGNRDFGDGVW